MKRFLSCGRILLFLSLSLPYYEVIVVAAATGHAVGCRMRRKIGMGRVYLEFSESRSDDNDDDYSANSACEVIIIIVEGKFEYLGRGSKTRIGWRQGQIIIN